MEWPDCPERERFSCPQSCHVPLLLLPIGQEGEQEEEGEQWRTVLVSSLPSLPASQSNIYHSEPANQHSVRLSELRGFLLLPGCLPPVQRHAGASQVQTSHRRLQPR